MNLLPTYEVWTWIAGWEGRYEVSNRGRVRSWIGLGGISHKTKGQHRFLSSPHYRKNFKSSNSYICIVLGDHRGVRQANLRIHREVAKIYNPNPDPLNKVEVNHINGDKSCNEWWNFEWVTRLESIDHAFRTGLIIPAVGECQSNTKLTNKQVLEIFASNDKTKMLAQKYGVSTHAVGDIKNGRTWWHLTKRKRKIKPSEVGRFKKQIV